MNVNEFIAQYRNHPVLFIGSGLSFRYLDNTYTWDALLSKVCEDIWGNDEHYLDIKSSCNDAGVYHFDEIASKIEHEFNDILAQDRDGKFKAVNDTFYEHMRNGVNLSRFKIHISNIIRASKPKNGIEREIAELKKVRKNIGSVITTNYDRFIEEIFEFNALVGNDILLSNPYGSIYKIHGCIDDVAKIIITKEDYDEFDKRYELIRAQLLSLFIHNPIIFLGYSINDDNIKKVLKTIFSYVQPNTSQAELIRRNFLLVEYEKDSTNIEIVEHDIDMNGSTIRINKIKTDNFIAIYTALSNITLPISAMDVRKVQNVVKEINSGGTIKVFITEDIEDMRNSDRILAIGSHKTIQYQYMTIPEIIQNYFKIIDESNSSILSLIDKHTISDSTYFPIFGFSTINSKIESIDRLKANQKRNLTKYIQSKCLLYKNNRNCTCDSVIKDSSIAMSYKHNAIMYAVYDDKIQLSDLEKYLKSIKTEEKKQSNYRRLLCLYDIKKYDSLPKVEKIVKKATSKRK
ncbi:SIR2 family protein [Bacteroides sp. 90-K9/2]|uniref:SIR2 family protein n=1 Tax=Bacteroides sp. 90-K9/2 TaxID=3142453 RepID=UPI0039B62B05